MNTTNKYEKIKTSLNRSDYSEKEICYLNKYRQVAANCFDVIVIYPGR